MGEVHRQLAVFKERQARKLGAVVAGDGLEHLIRLFYEVRHDLSQSFRDRFGGVVASLDPNTHPRHTLYQCEHARLILAYFAYDCIDLPMTEFCAKSYDFGAFFNAPTENLLVFTAFFSSLCYGGAFRADRHF